MDAFLPLQVVPLMPQQGNSHGPLVIFKAMRDREGGGDCGGPALRRLVGCCHSSSPVASEALEGDFTRSRCCRRRRHSLLLCGIRTRPPSRVVTYAQSDDAGLCRYSYVMVGGPFTTYSSRSKQRTQQLRNLRKPAVEMHELLLLLLVQ